MKTKDKFLGLLETVEKLGSASGENRVAFSGGVDSSLVALAVYRVYPATSLAYLGVSSSLSSWQMNQAESIAVHIGIPLRTVQTTESSIPEYVNNEGMSCYFCKTSLYDVMSSISADGKMNGSEIVLFNGTNADDLTDPTRVGLRAAEEFRVVSPLRSLTKREIRELSKYAGLPNWNSAASPCLRSRIQIGVPATEENLHRIEEAESLLKRHYSIPDTADFRVRHLQDHSAMIEAEEAVFNLLDLEVCHTMLVPLGFSRVDKRPFRSGSVSRKTQ